jgi:hypothetical protein
MNQGVLLESCLREVIRARGGKLMQKPRAAAPRFDKEVLERMVRLVDDLSSAPTSQSADAPLTENKGKETEH